jgi:lipoate-protein ligase B
MELSHRDVHSKSPERLQGIAVENWGEIPYVECEAKQLEYLNQIALGLRKSTLVICTHPPVVTIGRATQPGDVFGWDGETFEVARGGRATYHGPEQIVIYPILDLKPFGSDIRKHLRNLEQSVTSVLEELGIKSEIKDGETGVWVQERKVCSFGVACRQWISYHGLALYLQPTHTAYSGINPCGYKTQTMISVNELAGREIDREQLAQNLANKIISFYQY